MCDSINSYSVCSQKSRKARAGPEKGGTGLARGGETCQLPLLGIGEPLKRSSGGKYAVWSYAEETKGKLSDKNAVCCADSVVILGHHSPAGSTA